MHSIEAKKIVDRLTFDTKITLIFNFATGFNCKTELDRVQNNKVINLGDASMIADPLYDAARFLTIEEIVAVLGRQNYVEDYSRKDYASTKLVWNTDYRHVYWIKQAVKRKKDEILEERRKKRIEHLEAYHKKLKNEDMVEQPDDSAGELENSDDYDTAGECLPRD